MNAINSILLDVVGMISASLPQSWQPSITIGALPADCGLSVMIDGGGPVNTFMNKGEQYELDIVFNGKHKDQNLLLDTMNEAHKAISKSRAYRNTNDYQITNIATYSAPRYLDRDERGMFLYGSSLRVKFFYK